MAGGKHILGNQPSRHVFGTVRVGEKGQIVIPKEARELFKIGAGDTLLILGDERLGIIVSRPEVVSGAALSVFRGLDGEEKDGEAGAGEKGNVAAESKGNTGAERIDKGNAAAEGMGKESCSAEEKSAASQPLSKGNNTAEDRSTVPREKNSP